MPRRDHDIVAGHAEGPQGPPYQTTVTVGAASPGAPPGSDPEVVPSTKGMKRDTGGWQVVLLIVPSTQLQQSLLVLPRGVLLERQIETENHAVGRVKVVPWDGLMERVLPEPCPQRWTPSTALPGALAS